MADWTDGPEYAPGERPDAFVAPSTPALAATAVRESPDEPPEAEPTYEEPAAAPPLDHVGTKVETTRDPSTAFAVASSPLTSAPAGTPPQGPMQPLVVGSAMAGEAGPAPTAVPPPQVTPWGAVHAPQSAPWNQGAWAPAQPLALADRQALQPPPPDTQQYPAPRINPQAFPTPDAPQWYTQYGPLQPTGPQPVTTKALVAALTPGVLISLLAGGIVPALSVPLLVVAALLGRRQRYRRSMTGAAFLVGIGLPIVLAAGNTVILYGAFDVGAAWDALVGWCTVACWVMIPVLALIQGGALRRGEPPELP